TLDYMAPEQLMGAEVTGAADVYALGCLLHFLLTGRAPFAGTDAMVMLGHLNQPAPALEAEAARLQPVLDRALAKQPTNRPARAGELAAAATSALAEPAEPRAPARAAAHE